MITATTFGDVMKNGGDDQNVLTGDFLINFTDQAKILGARFITKAVQNPHEQQRMRIHRVAMKQIILHQPHDFAKGRQIIAQHPKSLHQSKAVK